MSTQLNRDGRDFSKAAKRDPKGTRRGIKRISVARGSESKGEGSPRGERGLVGRSQILESLANHVKNVFNQSRLEEKSTDLEQML